MNRGWSVPVAGLLLALVACSSSEAEPRTLPPVTTSPSASAAPSVPPFPATKQGAADFAKAYYEGARNKAAQGDGAQLRQLSTGDCESCTALIKYFDDVWANGSFRGGLAAVTNAETALVSATSADVTFDAAVDAFDEVDGAGHVTYHGKAARLSFTMHLIRIGAGWQVARLTRNA